MATGETKEKTRAPWRADLVLILGLLLLGAVAFLVLRLFSSHGVYAEVRVNGELAGSYPLSEDGEYRIADGRNLLVIEDGAAYMKEADCPDRVCVRTGKISRAGESILCLPNRVEVGFVGGDADVDFGIGG